MKQPLFSCVIPVKGERPFFGEAIDSLKAQGMGEDLEIIIQDGTTEYTEYTKNDLREVRWYREEDSGQSDALNKGFAKAKGDWFFWLNADDVLLPGALKKILDRINKIDGINWIAGNQLLIDDACKVLKCSVGNGWHDWLYRHAVPHVYGPSSFFRRELFERVGGLDVSLKYCMDWDLWIKFMKAGARFVRVDDYLWGFRQWAGSKTQHEKSREEIRNHDLELQRMLDKNDFRITRFGTTTLRVWRLADGSYLRGWIDTMLMRGRTL